MRELRLGKPSHKPAALRSSFCRLAPAVCGRAAASAAKRMVNAPSIHGTAARRRAVCVSAILSSRVIVELTYPPSPQSQTLPAGGTVPPLFATSRATWTGLSCRIRPHRSRTAESGEPGAESGRDHAHRVDRDGARNRYGRAIGDSAAASDALDRRHAPRLPILHALFRRLRADHADVRQPGDPAEGQRAVAGPVAAASVAGHVGRDARPRLQRAAHDPQRQRRQARTTWRSSSAS